LPEASNDSIFAILAEKFGFIGTVLILVIYGAFITRLKDIISRTPNMFSRILVVSVLAWFSTQMIINVGAMIGLLPLKGITLPLISQGGTSLLFMTAALGIVFQISRYTSFKAVEPQITDDETRISSNSYDGRGVRRPHNPALVTRPRT
jgi:cell division protein FtsW